MKHGLTLGVLPLGFLAALLLLWFLRQGAHEIQSTAEPKVELRAVLADDELAALAAPVLVDADSGAGPSGFKAPRRPVEDVNPPAAVESETQHLERLRALWNHEPELALKLIEETEARFGNGATGAERQWVKIRALTNLERFTDARETAREMLQRFPDENWTRDVEHHVLDHPETEAERRE